MRQYRVRVTDKGRVTRFGPYPHDRAIQGLNEFRAFGYVATLEPVEVK